MPPRASVIIPNLDCVLIDRTLSAIRAQELDGELEVVVVGRDGPGLVPRDGTVVWIETPDPVPAGAARNLGVAAARGEALLFTDADCEPSTQWAARLLGALERSPVAGGGVRFALSGNRWAVADNIASFHDLLTDRPSEVDSRGALGTLNLAATRRAWETVGGFDEALPTSEDYDWVLRARAAGLATGFEPRAVVTHAAVRRDRAGLIAHASWYGRHFNAFRSKHPGVFDCGPTWKSRRRLALAAPLKSLLAAVSIFRRHPSLLPGVLALPGVVRFKYAWYQAVLADWPAA